MGNDTAAIILHREEEGEELRRGASGKEKGREVRKGGKDGGGRGSRRARVEDRREKARWRWKGEGFMPSRRPVEKEGNEHRSKRRKAG
jgi:hypothetical protein